MNKNQTLIGVIIIVMIFFMLIVSSIFKGASKNQKNNNHAITIEDIDDGTLDEYASKVTTYEATPKKGQVNLEETDLYDEVPEISKYPLAVEGRGDIDIEIFTSGEKAGSGNDSWLIDVADEFNKKGFTTSDGQTVSMSVRSVSSGLAADYIISGKYYPDIYTPSNTLFGDYAITCGGKLELYEERLVGNTAGVLVKKDSYTDFNKVIAAVQDNEMNMGYTNPQTSATGLNLLMTLLEDGEDNFKKFNANIPYVAYTTQQMRDSAAGGSLDGMLTEYQAYINDESLVEDYNFIPFGVRHDNPAYIVDKENMSSTKREAVDIVINYCKSDEMQAIATRYGFNANDDYSSNLSFSGTEIKAGLKSYKSIKDNGKDIIAVFVADCSGSMDGAPMRQLKESLSNGANYINDNNYIGLVSYASDVTIELPIGKFDLNQRSYFQGGVESLDASGGTASYDALVVAMQMIREAKKDHPDAKCMIFLLSDGYVNIGYDLSEIESLISYEQVPIYTISYGADADKDELGRVSSINEAATINADSDDIIYKIKSLFNSQL